MHNVCIQTEKSRSRCSSGQLARSLTTDAFDLACSVCTGEASHSSLDRPGQFAHMQVAYAYVSNNGYNLLCELEEEYGDVHSHNRTCVVSAATGLFRHLLRFVLLSAYLYTLFYIFLFFIRTKNPGKIVPNRAEQ